MLPLLIGIIIFMLFFASVYNSLVTLRNHIAEAWSNIETELKRRYELIPNLVETVKGYARHERETLEHVVELRNQCAADRGSIHHQENTEKELVSAVRRLLALAEAYPELKADEHYCALQRELVNTEDRIQAARRFYNGNVREYRNKCEMFPSSLIARLFRFEPRDYFDVEPAVHIPPHITL